MNETHIGDIWALFADFIDKKLLESAAERYVELLVDLGVSDRILHHAIGTDTVLNQAIEYYLEEDEAEEDYEELGFE